MIRGNVEALNLVQLLQLIYDSEVSGELMLYDGDQQRRFHFVKGQILPIENARQMPTAEFEKGLYDLLFIERGSYIFTSRAPRKYSGPKLNTRSILVEASRRQDEWGRIKFHLPSNKAILIAVNNDVKREVAGKLKSIGVNAAVRFGKQSVEQMIRQTGSAFEVLCEFATFIEQKKLIPVPTSEIPKQIKARVSGQPSGNAMRLYEWMHEIPELADLAGEFDHVILKTPWLSRQSLGFKTAGPRALQMLSRLLRYRQNFEMTARGNESAICVTVQNKLLEVNFRGEINAPGIMERCLESGLITENQISEVAMLAYEHQCEPEDLFVHQGLLTPEQWLTLQLEQVLDICFSLFTWRKPLIAIRTEAEELDNFRADAFSASIVIPLHETVRQQLRMGLMKWKLFRKKIPSMDAIFVCAKPTPDGQAKRPYDYLDGRRRVSDLLAMSRATGQELLQFLYQAAKEGKIRALTEKEHAKRMRKALSRSRPTDMLLAYRSALSFGHRLANDPKMLKQIDKAKEQEKKDLGAVSMLEGKFNGYNLAALIQILLNSDAEGTLRVTDVEHGERVIHFVDKGLYMLFASERNEPHAPNSFINESSEDVLASLQNAMALSQPQKREELQQKFIEDILDALLWDAAQFEFARNFIPSEFYSKDKDVKKISIPSDMLLFRSMQRLAEWEDLRGALKSGRAIFEYSSKQARSQALKEYGNFTSYIDGKNSLDQIVSLSSNHPLEIYRYCNEMVEKELLVFKDMMSSRDFPRASSDRVRWNFDV